MSYKKKTKNIMAKDFTAYDLFFICCRKTNLVSLTRTKLQNVMPSLEGVEPNIMYRVPHSTHIIRGGRK